MPWLVNEDRAVKEKLQALTVTDANAPDGRPVAVRYRMPESQLAEQTFPMIVIQHAGVEKADDREHRGWVRLPYAPEGKEPWWSPGATSWDVTQSPYVTEFPIPYELRYQIIVLSRLQWHDMQLAAELAQPDRIPARFGFLEIPEDGTVRRLDLIGGPEISETRDENGKRLFRRDYLISVSSELLPSQVSQIVAAQRVDVTFEHHLVNTEVDISSDS